MRCNILTVNGAGMFGEEKAARDCLLAACRSVFPWVAYDGPPPAVARFEWLWRFFGFVSIRSACFPTALQNVRSALALP